MVRVSLEGECSQSQGEMHSLYPPPAAQDQTTLFKSQNI